MHNQLTSAPATDTANPEAAYAYLLDAGNIKADAAQAAVVAALQQLHVSLTTATEGFSLSRILRKTDARCESIYIWGDVGRGKSMLMDLFFATLPGSIKKRRVHFHRFMQEVHAKLHEFRRKSANQPRGLDPTAEVVAWIAGQADVVCFDELQATDVTDATLITRIFEGLAARGVIVVATSNRPPAGLYTGEVQRERFARLAQLIEHNYRVVALESPYDYRMQQIRALTKTYYTPLDEGAEVFVEAALSTLAPTAPTSQVRLEVHGRILEIELHGERIGKASFTELCEKPLGAADYLAMAEVLTVLVLTGIPLLTPEKRNEAKRFVTLIDALYEHKVKLIATAAAAPEALYPEGHGSFEFKRTASRLIEMQSEVYLAQATC